MKRLVLLSLVFLVSFTPKTAIDVIKWNDLEAIINKQDDKTYIINFWSTWCPPCIKEIPEFERINTEFKDQGVEVIFVSLDAKTTLESTLIPFVEKKKIKSRMVLLDEPDFNSWIPKVDKDWSGAIPTTLIINSSKKIKKLHEGTYTYQQLKEEIKHIQK